MILSPTTLVLNRMAPQLEAFYKKRNNKCCQRIFILLAAIAVIALPMTYAYTLMANPCSSHRVKIDPLGKGEENASIASFQMRDCSLEELLRSERSIGLGGILVIIALGLTTLMSLATTAFQACYSRCLNNRFLEAKRLMWRPLLLFWYFWVNPRVPKLKYANDGNIIPCLYTPASVLVCFIYIVLILEMSYVGYREGKTAVGLVIAYAMGEFFLLIANWLLGAVDTVILVTDAHIYDWWPTNFNKHRHLHGHISVLHKLMKLTNSFKGSCHLTCDDLQMLQKLEYKTAAGGVSDRMAGEDTLDDVGIFETVYLVDTMELVNVVTGEITTLSDIGQRASWIPMPDE